MLDPYTAQEEALMRATGQPSPTQSASAPVPESSGLGPQQRVCLFGKGWSVEFAAVLQASEDWVTILFDSDMKLSLAPKTRVKLSGAGFIDIELQVLGSVQIPVAQILTLVMIKKGAISEQTPSVHGTGPATTVDSDGEPIVIGERTTQAPDIIVPEEQPPE